MQVKVVSHPSGDQIPVLLNEQGFPVVLPSEFILGRRSLSPNTLVRNLRELAVLVRWADELGVDLWKRIISGKGFTEAEVKGSLIERLRRDQLDIRKVKKLTISPNTFNQRLTTVRQFLSHLFDIYLGSMSFDDVRYERIRDHKQRTINWLDTSFATNPPQNKSRAKGLTKKQVRFLIKVLDPGNPEGFGRAEPVRYRNFISVMLMLHYGLRPGELLSLRVSDIEFGAISAIRVTRRPPDPADTRRTRPRIKRNGRVLPIDNPLLDKSLDDYIMIWRDRLEERAEMESDYLILSDEGMPLSQASIVQFFQLIRERFPNELPDNLSAKSLRHTFSSNMERELRELGFDEVRREEALAELRGDSSVKSQAVYIAQEIEEQASIALHNYHKKLLA